MLNEIAEFLIFVGIIAFFAYTFLGDWWDIKRTEKTKLNNIHKIAQIKLISDDKKDIAQFITTNAQFLSNDMVKQLVERIELIKADSVINNDDNLKLRIDNLSDTSSSEEEETASEFKCRN